MIIWLIVILLVIFILPFAVKKIEEQIEIFLLVMAAAAMTVSGRWSVETIKDALIQPLRITAAVFFAGLVFSLLKAPIADNVNRILKKIGLKIFVFGVVVLLGLISSAVTAIIAALVLVEIIGHLKLDRKNEIKITVFACLSIGMGAVLTPIGEPLSAIITGKLSGMPHNAGFWFLARNLWFLIIPGIVMLGLAAVLFTGGPRRRSGPGLKEDREEDIKDIIMRAVKVYIFIAALVLLGTGFMPVIDIYITKWPFYAIYWANTASAALDNATLAAAEIGPFMGLKQIVSAILALTAAGGMLIPGNIPNIIAAGKLGIKSREWAAVGVPLCSGAMIIYFVIIITGGVK